MFIKFMKFLHLKTNKFQKLLFVFIKYHVFPFKHCDMPTLPRQHSVKALPNAMRHRKNKVGRRKTA